MMPCIKQNDQNEEKNQSQIKRHFDECTTKLDETFTDSRSQLFRVQTLRFIIDKLQTSLT